MTAGDHAASWLAAGEDAPPARTLHRLSRRVRQALNRRALMQLLARHPVQGATYLSKLSMPPFGAMGLGLAIPLLFATAVAGFLSGLMVLNTRRAAAFTAMLALLLAQQVVTAEQFSVGSLTLLVVVHLPYVFQLRRVSGPTLDVLDYFQRTALVLAVLGVVQYVLQFVIGQALAFPIDNYLPRALLLSQFNNQAVLHYGSATLRANGVFMLEPSFFSQGVGLALAMEVIGRRRRLWMLALGLGLLVSYSGTGVMAMAAALLVDGIARRRFGMLFAATVGTAIVVAVGLAADVPMITNLVDRSGEFGAAGSSASMRFVGGFALFNELLWPEPLRTLFGYGAGSFLFYGHRASMPIAEMMLFKTVFEFGLIGALAYFGFLTFCIAGAKGPAAVKAGVAMALFCGGAYTPFGHCLACGLLLWPAENTARERST